MMNSRIWSIDGTLTCTNTPVPSEPGSNAMNGGYSLSDAI